MNFSNPSHEILQQTALATPLQKVHWEPLEQQGLNFYIKREDLVSPAASGNKYYKLFHNLIEARHAGFSNLVSFGGAYSNHLHALAHVGQAEGFRTFGVIRGERPATLGPTLQDLEACGMELIFVTREQYRQKDTLPFRAWLESLLGPALVIPEGGSNELGAYGCSAITVAIERVLKGASTINICVPCGTGTTAAGLLSCASQQTRIHAFPVLKGADAMGARIETQARDLNAQDAGRLYWHADFHCGGYAKVTPELLQMMKDFEEQTGVLLDPVYTAKMLWGIKELAAQGQWQESASLVMVHTGGLQGRRGFGLNAVPCEEQNVDGIHNGYKEG